MQVLQACINKSVKAHVATSIAKFKILMFVFTFWCKELQLLNINIMNWTILVATSDFKNCPVFIYILVYLFSWISFLYLYKVFNVDDVFDPDTGNKIKE